MNLLCFLKHLLERRIARRREARRSDRLQRATPPRQRPEPTGTIADPCQPSVSRSTWKRAMQVVRLWQQHKTTAARWHGLAIPILLRHSLGRQTLQDAIDARTNENE